MTFVRSVAFQSFKQESGSFLNFGVLQEDLNHAVYSNLWCVTAFPVGKHLSEANGCLRIYWDNIFKDLTPVGGIVSFLAIGHDFVILIGFYEPLDYFVRSI